LNYTGETLKQ